MKKSNGIDRLIITLTILAFTLWACLMIGTQINNSTFIQFCSQTNKYSMDVMRCSIMLFSCILCFSPMIVCWIVTGFNKDKEQKLTHDQKLSKPTTQSYDYYMDQKLFKSITQGYDYYIEQRAKYFEWLNTWQNINPTDNPEWKVTIKRKHEWLAKLQGMEEVLGLCKNKEKES